MLRIPFSWFAFVVLGLATSLAACQGNLGSGSGISIPQGAQYTPPAGAPGSGQGVQSRQQALEGAVFLGPDSPNIPLPAVGGFAIEIALGTPPPAPSAAPSSSATVAAVGKVADRGGRAPSGRAPATAATAATAVPASRATPSPAPAVSPSASASASAAAPSATSAASALASGAPSPHPSPSGAKIATKTTIYPGDAPAAPTPQPSGSVQTFLKRTALVRGFLQPSSDVSIYGLGAIRFTIPAEEAPAQRGFTVALFSAGKKHRDTMLAYDPQAVLGDGVVASKLSPETLVLKKGTAYLLVLYGDELPATPAPVPPGYPAPANNPFVTPNPAGSGLPGAAGTPPPGASYAPNGPATYAPSAPATYAPTYAPH